MTVLGPTPGESWLAYIGLNPEYPHLDQLAVEADDAIWEAVNDVLAEWKRRDPLLRVMLDERCQLWTLHEWRAGDLHVGDRFEYEDTYHGRWSGVIRPLNEFIDGQWGRLTVHWTAEPVPNWTRWPSRGLPPVPQISPDSIVETVVPVPLDLSALLAIVDADQAALQADREARHG